MNIIKMNEFGFIFESHGWNRIWIRPQIWITMIQIWIYGWSWPKSNSNSLVIWSLKSKYEEYGKKSTPIIS